MKTKHTQGEWTLDAFTNEDGIMIGVNGEPPIALVYKGKKAQANAKLIAAAPDLLEACAWAIKQFKRLADEGRYPEFMMSINGGEGYIPLVKAIKKATE